jgi:hypothetical protein
MTMQQKPVLVTTAHRGVFFGYTTEGRQGDSIQMSRARNCVYWSPDVRGFLGLASSGPTASCRIGPAADVELLNVTAVVEVSPEAVKKWEAAPWS